jgi:predicted metal-dependent hydrolase
MKKEERVQALIQSLGSDSLVAHDTLYLGYFSLFNEQKYYEAHDVLEHLWLKTPGHSHRYFKGLIQLAGAFVHLRKQFERPTHPTDGRRLYPARRLFKVAQRSLLPFAPFYLGFDVAAAIDLCRAYVNQIEASEFRRNPWTPANAPRLPVPR